MRIPLPKERTSFHAHYSTESGHVIWCLSQTGTVYHSDPSQINAKTYPIHKFQITPGLWPEDHNCDACGNTGGEITMSGPETCGECGGSSYHTLDYEEGWYAEHPFGRWLYSIRKRLNHAAV